MPSPSRLNLSYVCMIEWSSGIIYVTNKDLNGYVAGCVLKVPRHAQASFPAGCGESHPYVHTYD